MAISDMKESTWAPKYEEWVEVQPIFCVDAVYGTSARTRIIRVLPELSMIRRLYGSHHKNGHTYTDLLLKGTWWF